MDLIGQIEHLRREKARAIDRERFARDAVFLHSDAAPLCENIGAFEALPFTLFHLNVLRMANSPFLPPFISPGPQDLALFLWVVSPGFLPGHSETAVQSRNDFFKRCRQFIRPASPKYWFSPRRLFYTRRAGKRFALFSQLTELAREYVREAFQDRAPAGNAPTGIEAPEYYSDLAGICHDLMSNYHGLTPASVQRLPLKLIYQLTKALKEQAAAEMGKPALLWNRSDNYEDAILALVNNHPVSAEFAHLLKLN